MNKRFLFYIGHPAHFYNFSVIAEKLVREKHSVLLVVRKRKIVEDLVRQSKFDYIFVSNKKKGASRLSLIWSVLNREFEVWRIIKRFKPDLMAGTDIVITHLGKLFNIPAIVLCDDDSSVVPLLSSFGFRFATAVVCPKVCDITPYNYKKIGYSGLQKMTYLHPKYFSPNKELIKDYIDIKQKYFLIRLVQLTAHHDKGISGINDKVLDNIIDKLTPYGRVYISCERSIPEKYNKYKLSAPPNLIHHIMHYASLFISDSQSMTVESCILAVPSIRFSEFAGKISVLEELEKKYKLTFGISPSNEQELLSRIQELIADNNIKDEWVLRRDKMLGSMIDVSEFIYELFKKKSKN
tara:strand:- start:2296 stop:3351 length:1056 start_codon:yes stop_codon:yes gene_type:complete